MIWGNPNRLLGHLLWLDRRRVRWPMTRANVTMLFYHSFRSSHSRYRFGLSCRFVYSKTWALTSLAMVSFSSFQSPVWRIYLIYLVSKLVKKNSLYCTTIFHREYSLSERALQRKRKKMKERKKEPQWNKTKNTKIDTIILKWRNSNVKKWNELPNNRAHNNYGLVVCCCCCRCFFFIRANMVCR